MRDCVCIGGVHVCVCVCGGAGGPSECLPLLFFILYFEMESLTLALTDWLE